MNKKLKVLTLLLTIFTCSIPAQSHNNYIVFKNANFNYKIILPGSWKRYNLDLEKTNIMYSQKDKNTEIKIKAFKSSEKDLKRIIRDTTWNLRKIDPTLNVIIYQDKIIIKESVKGTIMVFDYRFHGRRILNRILIAKNGDSIYIIECKSSMRKFYLYENIFNTALSSFSYLDASDIEDEEPEDKEDEEPKGKEDTEKKDLNLDDSKDNKEIEDEI